MASAMMKLSKRAIPLLFCLVLALDHFCCGQTLNMLVDKLSSRDNVFSSGDNMELNIDITAAQAAAKNNQLRIRVYTTHNGETVCSRELLNSVDEEGPYKCILNGTSVSFQNGLNDFLMEVSSVATGDIYALQELPGIYYIDSSLYLGYYGESVQTNVAPLMSLFAALLMMYVFRMSLHSALDYIGGISTASPPSQPPAPPTGHPWTGMKSSPPPSPSAVNTIHVRLMPLPGSPSHPINFSAGEIDQYDIARHRSSTSSNYESSYDNASSQRNRVQTLDLIERARKHTEICPIHTNLMTSVGHLSMAQVDMRGRSINTPTLHTAAVRVCSLSSTSSSSSSILMGIGLCGLARHRVRSKSAPKKSIAEPLMVGVIRDTSPAVGTSSGSGDYSLLRSETEQGSVSVLDNTIRIIGASVSAAAATLVKYWNDCDIAGVVTVNWNKLRGWIEEMKWNSDKVSVERAA